jgi:hypothetical protein
VAADSEETLGAGISFDPDEGIQAGGRLRMGAVLTLLLAKDLWAAVGLNPTVFDVIDFLPTPIPGQ